MSKPLIVLADTDEEYIISLELKLIQELGSRIDLEIITEDGYYQEFFSKPRRIEVLFVSEELYSQELQKHAVKNIFVLQETPDFDKTGDLNVHYVYKYTSVKEMYNEMLYICSDSLMSGSRTVKQTQVVLIYGPSGGVGKTTVALGLAGCLDTNYKKTLYIDAEYLQTFQYRLKNRDAMPGSVSQRLKGDGVNAYMEVKHCIRSEGFDYLPPFSAALSALNLDFSVYEQIISGARAARDYDFIVVDTDSMLTSEKSALIKLADKVLILMRQNPADVFCMEVLLKNLDISDGEKFSIVCNQQEESGDNFYSENSAAKYIVSCFIEKYEGVETSGMEALLAMEGLHKLAYLIS